MSDDQTTPQTNTRQSLYCSSDITLSQAIKIFLDTDMLGKSPLTKSWYEKHFSLLLQGLGKDRKLRDIFEHDLVSWYNELTSRKSRYQGGVSRPEIAGGLATDTLHGYIRACKRLFKWLYRHEILMADLAVDLKLPRLPKRGKKGISDIDRVMILEGSSGNIRDTAILRFLDATGARRGGVANLKMVDLNLDSFDPRIRRRVTVREKGDKERTVILTPCALATLEAWLKVRPNVPYDNVFLGCKSGHNDWQPLAPGGVSGILRRYKERLGLSGRCSPHQWRHRFARNRLEAGMSLGSVSQILGHSSIVVTAMYYGMFGIDQLQDQYDKYS
jgi:integrase/recombinase XerD